MERIQEERQALYVLSQAEAIGPVSVKAMLRFAGSYEEILQTPPAAFERAGILKGEKKLAALQAVQDHRAMLTEDMGRLEEQGIRIVTCLDGEYPKRLQNLQDRPLLLYVKGRLPKEEMPTASVIGARECSDYGEEVAEFFGRELSARGVQIVSGMAYGIDSAAGRGGLQGSGESYAVLGTGVNICYPKENYPLYEKLCAGQGGVISEFPPGSGALGKHFVMRNRIIAGLGDVLLVIEAKARSGTSITVEYALQQGKDVFALPGRITDPLGLGCNRLLRDGAIPLTSPSDVLDYFGIGTETPLEMQLKDTSGLGPELQSILEQMDTDAMHVEEISERCGLPLRKTVQLLYELENRGYVRAAGPAYYSRS